MADAIKRCADSLRALEAGASSRAESVTALLEQRDTLLDGIGKAEGRYRAAGEALETYSAALDRVQTDTLNALYAARQAKWERDEARDNQRYYQDLADDYAGADDDSGYGHDQQVRYTRLANSAGQDAAAAQDRIDNQVRVVQAAVADRDRAAQTAIDAIQGVTATDGLNDGWWEDYGAKVLGWIAVIAEWVANIAGILALVLCWVPVLGQALAVIAGIAGIVAAVANIGLALGGEKTWGEALLSVGFAALGCIGLGGLRGAVSSLKALKGFGGALKAAGGLKGAFVTFASGLPKATIGGLKGMFTSGKDLIARPIQSLKNAAGALRGGAVKVVDDVANVVDDGVKAVANAADGVADDVAKATGDDTAGAVKRHWKDEIGELAEKRELARQTRIDATKRLEEIMPEGKTLHDFNRTNIDNTLDQLSDTLDIGTLRKIDNLAKMISISRTEVIRFSERIGEVGGIGILEDAGAVVVDSFKSMSSPGANRIDALAVSADGETLIVGEFKGVSGRLDTTPRRTDFEGLAPQGTPAYTRDRLLKDDRVAAFFADNPDVWGKVSSGDMRFELHVITTGLDSSSKSTVVKFGMTDDVLDAMAKQVGDLLK
ncbi:hypothetical protein ABYF34_02335 [Buchananella felis]|uniref:hypothetical protein n=1 Tax=Buchananella felis TaxID=3231492 RepID=UPI0035288C30